MKKWPRGRRRQTVNLLGKTHVGSNPIFFIMNFKLMPGVMNWCKIWGGKRGKNSLMRRDNQLRFRKRSIFHWGLRFKAIHPNSFSVSNKYLYNGFYSYSTINFWPTIKYYRLRERTTLYKGDFSHDLFISQILGFWDFTIRAIHLIRNSNNRKFFVDSMPWQRVDLMHSLKRFKIRKFALASRYIFQANSLILFLRSKLVLKPGLGFFILQIKTKLQKLRIHLQTRLRQNIISLHPGLFSSLLNRSKASRKGKIVRLAMVKHLHHVISISSMRYIAFEVTGLPQFWGEIMKVLWEKPSERFRLALRDESQFSLSHNSFPVRIPFILFRDTIKYSSQKCKRKGRIKRKIWRRLQRQSHVSD